MFKLDNKELNIVVKEGITIPKVNCEQFEITDGLYIMKSKGDVKLIIPLSNIAYIEVKDKK